MSKTTGEATKLGTSAAPKSSTTADVPTKQVGTKTNATADWTTLNGKPGALSSTGYIGPSAFTPEAAPDMFGRFSRPGYFNGYASYLGIVPRRGWDEQTQHWIGQSSGMPLRSVEQWAQSAPLVLLRLLAYLHPLASQAVGNNLDLAFAPEDVSIVAVELVTRSDGTTTEKVSSEGTAVLTALWDKLAPELGKERGLMRSCGLRLMDCGLAMLEGVPDENPRNGLKDIYTIDPLTIRFRDTDEGRLIEQTQFGYGIPSQLPRERIAYAALDGDSDNPYGEPLFKAFLAEALADVREQKNLGDLMHSVVWPRLFFSFPFEQVVEYARTTPEVLVGAGGLGADGNAIDLSPTQYAFTQMELFKKSIQALAADDQLFGIKGGDAKTLTLAEGLAALDPIFQRRALRIASSLRHPATLLNIQMGGTQGLGDTNWRVYATQLRSLRASGAAPVLQIANLHLRLMGLNLVARLKAEPIRTTEKLTDAQADQTSIANAITKRDQGWITQEEASIEVTGSGPVGDAPAPIASVAIPPSNSSSPSNNQPTKEKS
ncbi:hypothetical protein [Armatimonas rosea]|uniref:Phage portal protein n=1 Tax=Armatimonas rosea TaxID=685828 RepID=A0A7W9SWK5_ARMRO|nr:hypothetical protein [Armatimonas rosea]MBB6053264.1 hypothetical protein [Armatimonas rosea]